MLKAVTAQKACTIYYRSYKQVSIYKTTINFLFNLRAQPQEETFSFLSGVGGGGGGERKEGISGFFPFSKTFIFKGSVKTHMMLKMFYN